MKCDKLKSLWVYCRDINEDEDEDFIEFAKKNGYEELVAKSDVDEAIAELKEFAENACLERDDNQTAIDELQSENRKLKRALWLARALRARDIQRWWIAVTCAKITERACRVWNNVERKCRAKAEIFKEAK